MAKQIKGVVLVTLMVLHDVVIPSLLIIISAAAVVLPLKSIVFHL